MRWTRTPGSEPRARSAAANARRRLFPSPAIRALDVGIPDMGSVWFDLEPAELLGEEAADYEKTGDSRWDGIWR